MKKILVLSLLGACCLNGNVCALGEEFINLALRRRPVSTFAPPVLILVQKNHDSSELIPLKALEGESYYSIHLKGLDEADTKAAFISLRRSKGGIQQDMSVDAAYSNLTRDKLYNLICADPQNLTIEDCEINEADIPVLIKALKKHQSLARFKLLERADQNISDKGLLDLYDALIELPALITADQIPDRPGLRDVYTALQDLTQVRLSMQTAAFDYFRHQEVSHEVMTRYHETGRLLQRQLMRAQAVIAAARARLAQE